MSEIEMKIGEYYETHKAKSALLVERQAVRIGLDALAFFFYWPNQPYRCPRDIC